MGDAVKKVVRSGTKIATGTFGEAKKLQKKTRQLQEKPFRKGATSEKRDAANKQEEQIKKQERTELLRLREAEGEVAKRKGQAFGKASGRRSLIRSAPTGLATTLGG